MRIVVVIASTRVSRRVAMLVDVPSIVVIVAVAACHSYGCHHH
jgi:hypothetical protein